MSELKTFRVAFCSTYHMRIRLKAGSASEAVKQAERIYLDDPGAPRVSMWRHNPFRNATGEAVVTFADVAMRPEQGGEP